jgi:hypothetical protein
MLPETLKKIAQAAETAFLSDFIYSLAGGTQLRGGIIHAETVDYFAWSQPGMFEQSPGGMFGGAFREPRYNT